MRNVETALAGDGDIFSRIELAIGAFQRDLIMPFAGSADAAELFDTNMTLARDITLAARAQLVALLSRGLTEAQATGAITLEDLNSTPADLAAVIVAAMEGIKDAQVGGQDLVENTRLFLRLLRQALTWHLRTSRHAPSASIS